jgi:O-succinylbenzoic acid--CoA ligase
VPLRPLRPLAVTPGELLPGLSAAIDGSGPAVLPLPGGPEGERLRAAIPPVAAVEDGVAAVVATSGSTGAPKGVLLTSAALLHSARATHARLAGPGQWLLALPASRIAGLQVLVRSLVAGTSPVVLDRLGSFAEATQRLDPTRRRYTALVPTQLMRLLDARIDLSAYDAILLGGAAASAALIARARSAGARVIPTYGMTETCGGCVYDGEPLDGVRVIADADGRLRISGRVLAGGYLFGAPSTGEGFAEGWFRTADLGTVDADGTVTVLGRADDVIVTGGVNVAPGVVEATLAGHPAVRECAVVGRADEEWGQRVVAYVVPTGPAPTLAELRDHVLGQIGKAAAPRELILVDALPLLSSGKVDRNALRLGRLA